jgi:hypothetical protein
MHRNSSVASPEPICSRDFFPATIFNFFWKSGKIMKNRDAMAAFNEYIFGKLIIFEFLGVHIFQSPFYFWRKGSQ